VQPHGIYGGRAPWERQAIARSMHRRGIALRTSARVGGEVAL
jgi:hypothetical protein